MLRRTNRLRLMNLRLAENVAAENIRSFEIAAGKSDFKGQTAID